MKSLFSKAAAVGVYLGIFSLGLSSVASAHVVVKPAEVMTAGFQTFTVGAPNEKEVAFNRVELKIPEGLEHVTPEQMAGWDIKVTKEGEGEQAVVKSIVWSGNEVRSGFRQDFTFSAKVPSEATEIRWKAYQTYTDGLVVSWDLSAEEQPKKEDGSPDFSKSGPFSVTKVVSETEAEMLAAQTAQKAVDAETTAKRALYVGVAGAVLSVVAVYLASKK